VPPPPQGQASSTITANKERTRYRKPFRLAGQVTGTAGCTAPYEVSLEKRVHGTTAIRGFTRVTTDGSGGWQTAVRSRKSADYFATVTSTERCQGSRSDARPVAVRVQVSRGPVSCSHKDQFPSGASGSGACCYRLSLEGPVRPNHGGTKVQLQRHKRKGGWRLLDVDRLNRRSRFSLSGPTCDGRYRIVWRKQAPENIRGEARFRL
jgi:hypothetical protein